MNTLHGLEVRRARQADAPRLARLRYVFRSEETPPVEDEHAFLERCTAWMDSRLADASSWRAWVLEDAREIVGNIWLQAIEKMPNPIDEPELHAYVSNLFVEPSRRNAGAGSRLLSAALAECRTLGVDVVFLWPSPRSRSLYARHDFRGDSRILALDPR